MIEQFALVLHNIDTDRQADGWMDNTMLVPVQTQQASHNLRHKMRLETERLFWIPPVQGIPQLLTNDCQVWTQNMEEGVEDLQPMSFANV